MVLTGGLFNCLSCSSISNSSSFDNIGVSPWTLGLNEIKHTKLIKIILLIAMDEEIIGFKQIMWWIECLQLRDYI